MGGGLGYCRRLPPVLSTRDAEGFERMTEDGMSCGEWVGGNFDDWRAGK
jgi:hypothetical protein